MATEKQKRLAREIALNAKRDKPLSKKELMIRAGYSEVTADTKPKEVTENPGVREELENLGFSVDNAKRVVAEIMDNERISPNSRLMATHQVFQVHGAYAPKKNINVNATVEIDEEKKKELKKLFAGK